MGFESSDKYKQNDTGHIYIAIDLKSFYASVECVERGLDPLTTNLVVADESRTEKTICLAVSPSLKAYGISGRARLFEVVQKANEIKAATGKKIDYIVAKPRMAYYVEYSTKIYNIYLRYIAPEDIHVYSVDEVFIDVTSYLKTYEKTPRELAMMLIMDVLKETGIDNLAHRNIRKQPHKAGIGTNLYLCKVAMDIVAKHIKPDKDGVRIAELNEISYRRILWGHKPITDFWRVGRGYAKRLAGCGIYTMGDVARCSIGKVGDFYNEELLYKLFGINAELLIDHAWGYEPCTIADIKAYKPENNSISSGQVLTCPYDAKKAKLVVMEMTDMLVLDLVEKGLVTDQMVLTVGYDIENLKNSEIRKKYKGEYTFDRYGRKIPKHAHGTINLKKMTSSTKIIMENVAKLYDEIINSELLVRRMNVVANHVTRQEDVVEKKEFEQLDLFTDYGELEKQKQKEKDMLAKEKRLQKAMIDVKKKYGKNAILKGMNLEEGATAMERNRQIGGHRA